MVQEIKTLQVGEIFSWKKVRIPTAGASVIFLILLLASLSYPELSKNSFKRWSLPFASIERTTLTEILNDEIKALPFSKMNSTPLGFHYLPQVVGSQIMLNLFRSDESKLHLISSLNGGIYEFNIPPQTKNFSIDLIVGDYRKTFSVHAGESTTVRGFFIISKISSIPFS